jgi:hypothetical protein
MKYRRKIRNKKGIWLKRVLEAILPGFTTKMKLSWEPEK